MRKISIFILAALSLCLSGSFISCAYGHSLVFGPEIFSSESGESQQIVKRFSVADVNQQFFISVQTGNGGAQKMGRSEIKINGKLIFQPDELGKQFKMLTKAVKLQKKNEVFVELTSEKPIVLTIMSLKKQTVTTKIPPLGDKVILKEYATVEFPAGAFDSTQDVRMSITTSRSKQDIFEADATGPRLPYEIRINTGNKAPKTDITVSIKYPDSFFSSHYQMHIFAQMHNNPDAPNVHDRFVMIDSGLDDEVEMAMTTLPKDAFSNLYGKNGTYEAIITVGLTD
jgi:hypothetical protein